ncbi:transposase [Streptomyces sp. NPDC059785]|uniref:IS701 family transposase n=1 Tax=Streptomyces sp. NPDC059785 TaxID=3346945 RepID=UPI0036522807
MTTCWADERVYYPVHARPYTPAHHFPRGKKDPGFQSKLQIAVALATEAKAAGLVFRAVAADCAYGDHDSFRAGLHAAGLAFVMALEPRHGAWSHGTDAYTPVDAAHALAWTDADRPGDWTRIERAFRDGHAATWWAAEARLGWWGPDGNVRLAVATTDPATLPEKATWYLATDLPRPGSPRAADSPNLPADLAEIVRIYGLRHWVEQSYKQVKDELGWADFQVRSDTAIRRHQTLVNCAFSFCWSTWFAPPSAAPPLCGHDAPPSAGKRGHNQTPPGPTALLAPGDPGRPWLAGALEHAATLLTSLDNPASTQRTPSPDQRRCHRQTS